MKKIVCALLVFIFINNSNAQDKVQVIKIGSQIWDTKNLNVSSFRNGEAIPEAKTAAEWKAAGEQGKPAFCYYNNDPENGRIYGKLYNWYAVIDPRGLAPNGWHVPSDAEWTSLSTGLGGDQVAGGTMKETGTTHWLTPNTGATNSSGFIGLPGGSRSTSGGYFGIGDDGYWWSSMESGAARAWGRDLSYRDGIFYRDFGGKQGGFSVRCVRD